MTDISIHGAYGDPRQQAARANRLVKTQAAFAGQRATAGANPHGFSPVEPLPATPWQPGPPNASGAYGANWMHGHSPKDVARMRDRFENFLPQLSTGAGPGRAQDFFSDMLPPGAALAPGAGGGYRQAQRNHYDMRRQASSGAGVRTAASGMPLGGQLDAGGGSYQTTQRPYQPEFDSPDRQSYPVHRSLANLYWRLFYKLDPVTGNGVDMYCLPAGELVTTPDGLASIEALQVGDIVDAPSGGTQEVEKIGGRLYEGEMMTVKAVGMLPFRCTDHHPVYAHRKKRVRDARSGGHGRWEPEAAGDFVQASTLTPKDYLKVPKLRRQTQAQASFDLVDYLEPSAHRAVQTLFDWDDTHVWSRFGHHKEDRKVPRHIEPSEELAELMGWYAAEGSKSRTQVTFSLNANETQYAERITALAMKLFDLPREAICWSFKTNNGLNVTVSCSAVAGLFRQAGDAAESKRVPAFVLRGSTAIRRAFLRAYLYGDGSESDAYDVKAGTISRTLAVQVQQLGMALGVFFSMAFSDRTQRRETTNPGARDVYSLRATKRTAFPRIFEKEAPEFTGKPQSLLAREYEDHWLVPIRKVEREEWHDWVFDIQVPEHAFCLPAVVHNSELPWGNFELTGEGVDGEVKTVYERMCEVTAVRNLLPYFVREYLVVGEACPHCFYDDSEGMWTYIGMHNPDQLEVIYTPFIKMDPIVRFKPDHRLQQVLNSSSEMVRAVRESMPPQLLSALMSGQHIELSPLNFTFLPRKMHPYDVRGTSILSRMWRAFMYEDAIFNASIATARRHAGPIKVAKLGDRTTGWIPDPSHERKLLELLAQAEMDPLSWLVYHFGIEFDLVGTTDRMMTIDKHWDLIERIKLIALGISKAFLHGEVTYASAASGLTVFLQRLKNLREFFEHAWIYPKFFRPVAEMNQFVKPSAAEAASASTAGPYIKTRRSHRELVEDDRYIIPRMEWDRQLDPTVESAQITAVQSLQGMGVTFSKSYLSSLVGRDWEEELNQRAQESKIEKEIMDKNPELQMALQPPPGADGGMGGGGIMPGLPPESLGFPGDDMGMPGADLGMPGGDLGAPGGDMAAPGGPEVAGVHGDQNTEGRTWKAPDMWERGRYKNWQQTTVADLLNVFDGESPEDDLWVEMLEASPEARAAFERGDSEEAWQAVEDYLSDVGYPSAEILTLEDLLKIEHALVGEPRSISAAFDLESEAELLSGVAASDLLVGVT